MDKKEKQLYEEPDFKKRSTIKRFLQIGVLSAAGLGAAFLLPDCGENKGNYVDLRTQPRPLATIIQNEPSDYSVSRSYQSQRAIEYRFRLENHHFMTLIDQNGNFIFRPHPGDDVNGWGSSWYAQPFSNTANIELITVNSGNIGVEASGSRYPANWSMDISFSYNRAGKKITGNGEYSISLDDVLAGNLDIFKIASNYLTNVPLLSGGSGNTGDMERADVRQGSLTSLWFAWVPNVSQPGHYPQDLIDNLSIDVLGQHNNVDTAAQGYAPIQAAYKPGMKVILRSREAGIPMMFGAYYYWDLSQEFWQDNVKIHPYLVNPSATTYNFDIEFESEALPGG